MTITTALIIAIYYGVWASQPLILFIGPSNFGAVIGLVIGLIMGNTEIAVATGAFIQVMYMGIVHYGGTKAVDEFAACIIAIPITAALNLTVGQALVLAAVFGMAGTGIDRIWKRINTSVWGPYVDRACEKLNYGAILRGSGIYPMLTRIVFSAPAVLLIIYFGIWIGEWGMNILPAAAMEGIDQAGKLFPIMGIALFLKTMGYSRQIPFFFIGYGIMAYCRIPWSGGLLLGAAMLFLFGFWNDREYFDEKGGLAERKKEKKREKKQGNVGGYRKVPAPLLWFSWFRLMFLHMVSQADDRQYFNSFTAAVMPVLRYLYKGRPDADEQIREGLKRTRSYYLCQQSYSGILFAVIIRMEEEKANTGMVSGEMISMTRASLMGPMSGMGDSVNGSSTRLIAISAALPFCLNGSAAGAAAMLIGINILPWYTALIGVRRGYNDGNQYILTLLSDKKIKKFVDVSGIFILFMLGSTAAQFLNFDFSFYTGGTTAVILNRSFDRLIPGSLTLVIIFVYYILSGKRLSLNKMYAVTAAAAFLTVIGAVL